MIHKALPHEKELLRRLSQNSQQAFGTIYQFYSQRLYGKLFKLLRSRLHADEIHQEVFMIIWEQRHAIDPARSFRSYLFRIAENKVYDHFRKTTNESNLHNRIRRSCTEGYSHIEASIEAKENAALLNRVIGLLPLQCRTIFRLCKLEGKSYKEVSEKLHISTSTISNHIVKATAYIRNHLLGYSSKTDGLKLSLQKP